jgi:DnaJ like chaperone protein
MKAEYKGTLIGLGLGWFTGRFLGSILGATLGRVYDSVKVEPGKNPYTVLGIDRSATNEEVKKRYLELSVKYHPDKVTHLGEELKALAHRKFVEVSNAYEEVRKERGL